MYILQYWKQGFERKKNQNLLYKTKKQKQKNRLEMKELLTMTAEN